MTQHIKLVGTTNPSTDYTAEYRIGDAESPTVVKLGQPVLLSADEKAQIESLGGVFADSNADERDAYEKAQESGRSVGDDVAGAAPLIGNPGGPNQTVVETPANADVTPAPDADQSSSTSDTSDAPAADSGSDSSSSSSSSTGSSSSSTGSSSGRKNK